MTPQGYDSRHRGNRRRRLSLRPDRKPRDLRIAGFLVYLAVLWGVYQLPQAALTRWFSEWMG